MNQSAPLATSTVQARLAIAVFLGPGEESSFLPKEMNITCFVEPSKTRHSQGNIHLLLHDDSMNYLLLNKRPKFRNVYLTIVGKFITRFTKLRLLRRKPLSVNARIRSILIRLRVFAIDGTSIKVTIRRGRRILKMHRG